MSMDVSQLTQMTTWLDEEHRRDKAELIRLQQRLESQEAEQQDQARVIKELETRLMGMQAQLLKYAQLEKALQQLKEEVVQMFTQADERRQQEGREAERVRSIERDNVSRALNEVRRDLQRLPRLDEEMGLRKAEQRRLGDSLTTAQQDLAALSQDVENKLRSLSFLEEGRNQDTKRIARLQQESLEALKRIEQHASRLQMVEDVIQRQERDTTELKELVSQLRVSQREFTEKQLLEFEHLKRQIAEWVETLETYVQKMDAFTARMQEFGEAFREDRHVVESIERFQEGIRREQTQVAELQRLAEERQKRQLEQWGEESEKRWRKELLRWDHQWGEQAKRNSQIASQFNEVEARLAQHHADIDAAWKFLQSQITYQTQESRRWLGEMNRLLEERPKKE
jgi:chromosome segregation ATPase